MAGGRVAPIDKAEYTKLIKDRPRKFTGEEVGYRKAPRGSEQRCENCLHFYERRLDRFGVCEIFRNAETDRAGVDRKYLCDWWTATGDDHPLAPTPDHPGQ